MDDLEDPDRQINALQAEVAELKAILARIERKGYYYGWLCCPECSGKAEPAENPVQHREDCKLAKALGRKAESPR